MVLRIKGRAETFNELQTVRFYKDVLCEFTLTFMLMFAVNMSALNYPDRPSNVFVANFIGLYVVSLVEGWAHVQLCVMNPNVSLLFVLNGSISIPKGILFCMVELAATISASQLVSNVMTPEEVRNGMVATGPREGISTVANWFSEAIAVAVLVSVIIGSGDGDRKKVTMPGLGIGLCVMSVCIVGAPWGISLNPAVVMGYAVATNDFSKVWVYWTSGFFGSFFALVMYTFLESDHGVFGGSKKALERFPSMNMSISQNSDSPVDKAIILSRMESIIEAMKEEERKAEDKSAFNGTGLQNGYQLKQRTADVDVRL